MHEAPRATIVQASHYVYLIMRRLRREDNSPPITEIPSFAGGLQHTFIHYSEQFGAKVETTLAQYESRLEETITRASFKNPITAKGFVLYFREYLMSPYDEKIGLELKL